MGVEQHCACVSIEPLLPVMSRPTACTGRHWATTTLLGHIVACIGQCSCVVCLHPLLPGS